MKHVDGRMTHITRFLCKDHDRRAHSGEQKSATRHCGHRQTRARTSASLTSLISGQSLLVGGPRLDLARFGTVMCFSTLGTRQRSMMATTAAAAHRCRRNGRSRQWTTTRQTVSIKWYVSIGRSFGRFNGRRRARQRIRIGRFSRTTPQQQAVRSWQLQLQKMTPVTRHRASWYQQELPAMQSQDQTPWRKDHPASLLH